MIISKEKINNLKLEFNNIYVVLDFDGTITTVGNTDSWDVAGKFLGDEFNKEINALYKVYNPIELDYKIPYIEKFEAMEKWYSLCMNLYSKYNLTESKLNEAIANCELELREGAKEFLLLMKEKQVPVIILSAGIGNVILGFLKRENCYFDNMKIISNFIEFSENGNAKEYTNNIINSMTKKLDKSKLGDFAKKLENREYKVLVGDLIEDKNMVPRNEWDTTIDIGILNDDNKSSLQFYKENFSILLTDKDATFETIKNILRLS